MSQILVVDDDLELRETISELLVSAGWQVDTAVDGEDTLKKISEKNYDLVLLDLILPGLQGGEVLSILKRQQPNLRVVMMTAYSTVDNAVEIMRRGAEDYLTKPFRSEELITTVRRVLEEARLQECSSTLNNDSIFSALSNVFRRRIILFLKKEGRHRFMEITRELEIEDHTKVNFHLKVLKENDLIKLDDKYYVLTNEGNKVAVCLYAMINSLT